MRGSFPLSFINATPSLLTNTRESLSPFGCQQQDIKRFLFFPTAHVVFLKSYFPFFFPLVVCWFLVPLTRTRDLSLFTLLAAEYHECD